ncbi:hypothetical protein WJX74_006496 [Apatococcus lobatus]|uniref:PX domain-containing protein n=1 Tax=Apatococcus lobatus TaxID=904363 RepID=A0AAW1RSN9_9CHLO
MHSMPVSPTSKATGSSPELKLVQGCFEQVAKICFLAGLLAFGLTMTSSSMLLNIPVALASVTLVHWLMSKTEDRISKYHHGRKANQPGAAETHDASAKPAVDAHKRRRAPEHAWKSRVKAPVAEHAWETLCNSIVQEFIYDIWYAHITPDRDFPREIRHILNWGFGELAARARRLELADLRKMLLRDLSELLMVQIELFRQTRESIVQGLGEGAFRGMTVAARERAFVQELKADGNLHPALYSHNDSSPALLGHYRVLRHISDGMMQHMLERADYQQAGVRAAGRELLASCVLRQLILFFTPHNANKVVLSLLQERVRQSGVEPDAALAKKPHALKARWDFQQRCRDNAALEEATSPAARRAHNKQPATSMQPRSSPSTPPQTPVAATAGRSGADALLRRSASHGDLQTISPTATAEAAVGESGLLAANAAPLNGHLSHSTGKLNAHLGLPPEPEEGFRGRPRAKVVAADLKSEAGRDFVTYKVRVADDVAEWTVSRRFRNFEALHSRLRQACTQYTGRLPPKQLGFGTSQSVQFVEQRRTLLDAYLQYIVADPVLASSPDVFEFLSAWSDIYSADAESSFLKAFATPFTDVKTSMRRAMEDLDDRRRQASQS